MRRILITGPTGRAGRHVVSQLLATHASVRAVCRHPDTAGLPPEVEVVSGDLTVPETLDASLDGVDAVFLVWCAPAEAVATVIEKIAKRARRIVFLSSPYTVDHPFFQAPQPNAISLLHAEIEQLIRASGLKWTFLRPGMFSANALWWWTEQIRTGDVVRWPYAHSHSAPIDERDIASVAVHALCDERCDGAEYVLTGPQSMSQLEQVSTIGEVLGRSLRFEEITAEEWIGEQAAPASILQHLIDAWAAGVAQPAYVTSTVAEVTGTPARPFRDWVVDNAVAFRMATG